MPLGAPSEGEKSQRRGARRIKTGTHPDKCLNDVKMQSTRTGRMTLCLRCYKTLAPRSASSKKAYTTRPWNDPPTFEIWPERVHMSFQLCYIVPHYVMLWYHIMLCYVIMLRYVMLCFACVRAPWPLPGGNGPSAAGSLSLNPFSKYLGSTLV